MPEALFGYDKDLPEVPDRSPYLPPRGYLVKDPAAREGYRLVEGRRPSQLLLVNRLRSEVDRWRAEGYPGASEVTLRLFNFWFEEDHLVEGKPWRYYFAQREALETLAYLVEIAGERDIVPLIQRFGEIYYPEGAQQPMTEDLSIRTLTSGERRVERFFPEVGQTGEQDLPPENLRRYAFKMATGSGKTVVMAMAIVWSHFHKQRVPDSPLSTNFLVLAPNVIVYQRLEKDFASNRIFHKLPLVPPEWTWNQKVILRGESAEPDPSANLIVTNIQQIYASRERDWTPANPIDALLGRKPVKDLSAHERPMLERIKSLRDLVVLNDEAHRVHDEELEWYKTLMSIHEALPGGLALWLDFTATPKFQDGSYYPWCIVDYPLAQAVEDRVVKAPIIVHRVEKEEPRQFTGKDIGEKYNDWVVAALARYREHEKELKKLGIRPVLFIMCENNRHADGLGEWLIKTKEFRLKEQEVLIIHTDSAGGITKKDLEKAREAARDIDKPTNKIKVIVSVMMLREGWDVRNVTVILGLRPFTAKANILPEQAIGRGLRLMPDIGPDKTQTLEVIGNQKFEALVRELEKEGVAVHTVTSAPPAPIRIEPLADRVEYDIELPITEPTLQRQFRRLQELDPLTLEPIFDQEELDRSLGTTLKLEFATTETEVHQAKIVVPIPASHELLSSLTTKVIDQAKLGMGFAELYPKVRTYVQQRCFGKMIDLENDRVRYHLSRVMLQEAIAKYLARHIGHLTVERKEITFRHTSYKLSDTKRFQWRRDLGSGPLKCKKTIFSYVSTYNPYERRFAQFLDAAPDILRFAALGSTQQGDSGTQFRVDYIKPSGAIGFYYPDFVAVQQTEEDEVYWIIETKGRIWEDTEAKDRAIEKWCKDVSERLSQRWRYVRINQPAFREAIKQQVKSFSALIEHCAQDKLSTRLI